MLGIVSFVGVSSAPKTTNKRSRTSKCTSAFATWARVRVARARAAYPSQLDHSGICVSKKTLLAGQSGDGRAERARPVAGLVGNLSRAGMSFAQQHKNQSLQVHQRFRHRYASPGCSGEGRVS